MTITGATPVYAVLGDPVAHSLSPLMHNAWIADHGLDAVYVALHVASLEGVRGWGLAGANVTIPHKETAAGQAQQCSEAVAVLGAANTLIFGREGVSAHNTDAPGLLAALDEADANWRGRTGAALVLGAGGAAAGAAWALKDAGVSRVVIANRTPERGAALAARLGVESAPWAGLADAFADADLIVNATSVGLGGVSSIDWPFHAARSGALAMDMVYKPLRTPFLTAAAAAGMTTCDGLAMLVHQGALAFELWFGVRPDSARARARLLAALGEGTP